MYREEEGKSSDGTQIQNRRNTETDTKYKQISVNRMQNMNAALKTLVVECSAKYGKINECTYRASHTIGTN